MRSKGFTLIELMIVIAIIAIIAAIAIPNILNALMATRESNARNSLKAFSNAEEDFKKWAGNAYWIKSVYGLYSCRRAGETTYPERVKEPVAKADRHTPPAAVYTFTFSAVDNGEEPVPVAGWTQTAFFAHWYHAMNGYVQGGTNMAYSAEANGGTGAAADPHPGNTSKYGFIAYPDVYKASGRYCYIISEGAQVYRRDPTADLVYTPGAIGACTLVAGGTDYLWFPETPTEAGWTAE
jgi:prepilin-type N-terminal cleavage/methylation domain-containing protein